MESKSLLPTQKQLNDLRLGITKELILASSNQSSSLSFHQHPIPKHSPMAIKNTKLISIGGSNFTTADLTTAGINCIQTASLPNITTFTQILQLIFTRVTDHTKSLAISFAHNTQPIIRNYHLDGIFISSSKETQFQGLDQTTPIGKQIETQFFKTTNKKISVYLANDTVCLALAAKQQFPSKNIIALVIGTGLNAAITNQNQIINLELGNYNGLSPDPHLQKLLEATQNPTQHLLEKYISGEYLFRIYNLLNSNTTKISSTHELDQRANLKDQLATTLLKRSAQLSAAAISALLDYYDSADIAITTDGSLINSSKLYKNYFQDSLEQLTGIPHQTFPITNSQLIGASQLIYPV